MGDSNNIFYFSGSRVKRAVLPENTRVVAAPEADAAVADARTAVRAALQAPVSLPPLAELVQPSSRVVIAFDDLSLPLPLMRCDVRAVAAEVVIAELIQLGVVQERISFLCANGLHRKYTMHELQQVLGARIVSTFQDRIRCHDAEDTEGIASLGETASGNPVEVNRAIVESDLVIYLSVPWTPMNGGWKSLAVGCGTYRSISAHHRPEVLAAGDIMEPGSSAFHRHIAEAGEVIGRHVRVLQIEMALTNSMWEDRYWYFRPGSSHGFLRRLTLALYNTMPEVLRQTLLGRLRSAYGLAAVEAGEPGEVHREMLPVIKRNLYTQVTSQTDAVFFGVPDLSPYSVFSKVNPLLAANVALGYIFNLYRGAPVVRKGGVLIFSHPFKAVFDTRRHPSYVDFFERVLPVARSPAEIAERFEREYAADRRFAKLYREKFAFHGVHPFYAWYWCAPALEHLSKVIVADCEDFGAARRLGFEPARDLSEALSIAGEFLGKEHSLRYLWLPPLFGCAVGGA